MTLASHINDLTRPHIPPGSIGGERVPPLLDQLAAAVHPSQAGGASGGSKLRIPIDSHAMSIWQDIDHEARRYQQGMTGDTSGTLAGIIQSWETLADLDQFLERVTLGWCDRIRELLEPRKPYRPNAPCPHCGEKFVGEERAQALAVYWRDADGNPAHPSEWTMECAACQAAWSGDDLGVIAYSMSGS